MARPENPEKRDFTPEAKDPQDELELLDEDEIGKDWVLRHTVVSTKWKLADSYIESTPERKQQIIRTPKRSSTKKKRNQPADASQVPSGDSGAIRTTEMLSKDSHTG